MNSSKVKNAIAFPHGFKALQMAASYIVSFSYRVSGRYAAMKRLTMHECHRSFRRPSSSRRQEALNSVFSFMSCYGTPDKESVERVLDQMSTPEALALVILCNQAISPAGSLPDSPNAVLAPLGVTMHARCSEGSISSIPTSDPFWERFACPPQETPPCTGVPLITLRRGPPSMNEAERGRTLYFGKHTCCKKMFSGFEDLRAIGGHIEVPGYEDEVIRVPF